MAADVLRYDRMVEDALRGVVREALRSSIGGLPGPHHFYITFRTDYPGVTLSKAMRARYPEEITIVLQHQYWDLVVTEDWFEVTLSFNRVSERLHVPFVAVTAFADPSVKFGLQFKTEIEEKAFDKAVAEPMKDSAGDDGKSAKSGETKTDGGSAEVIAFDAFRRK